MSGLAALGESCHLLSQLAVGLSGVSARASLSHSRPGDNLTELTIVALYTLLLFAINWSVRFTVMVPLARRVLVKVDTEGGLSSIPLVGPADKKVHKFAQAAMEASFYSSFSFIGLIVVLSQPWVWPSSQWWDGITDPDTPHALMRNDLRCYYLLYTARYAQGIFSTLLEAKRLDFWEMVLHHSVTVVLCVLSYFSGYTRVGAVVMCLLDPADIPLHFGKMCKYAGFAFWADRLFELFAIMWFVMRLMMYPYVCWSAHIERQLFTHNSSIERISVLLLDVLLVLQVYWFSLIIKAAIKSVRTGNLDDVRSDSEEELPLCVYESVPKKAK